MGHEFDSPFEILEKTFELLVAGPEPLSLDGRLVRELPDRPIPLDELRGRLLHPAIGYHTRDVALVLLLRRAKQNGGAWTVGLCRVVLPGLRRAAVPLAKALPGRVLDLEAEMLAALVQTIHTAPAKADRLAARLVWPSVRAGHRFLVQERRRREWETPHARLESPLRAPQHPDLVLEAAVAASVITAQEAELIGESRVGEVPLRVLARRWGVPYDALRKRRMRAEPALTAWLLTRHPGAAASAATYRQGRSRRTLPHSGSATTLQQLDGT